MISTQFLRDFSDVSEVEHIHLGIFRKKIPKVRKLEEIVIMEELDLQERPGLLSRISGFFGRERVEDEEVVEEQAQAAPVYQLRSAYRYSVSIRKDIGSFDDAYAAANGLKRGDQQILNLTSTDPVLRQKIVDFMAGVAFAQEANWETIGDHIYLVSPASSYVEVVPGDGGQPTKFTGSFFSN